MIPVKALPEPPPTALSSAVCAHLTYCGLEWLALIRAFCSPTPTSAELPRPNMDLNSRTFARYSAVSSPFVASVLPSSRLRDLWTHAMYSCGVIGLAMARPPLAGCGLHADCVAHGSPAVLRSPTEFSADQ